jgi:hypothetical protein
MNIFSEFIEKLHKEKPELDHFAKRIQVYFNASGFQANQFERAVENGLTSIETETKKHLTVEQNESKKDND